MQSLHTGKGFLLAFLNLCVLSYVRPVALIFQHDLFFFHSLGAALAEQMNQIMLLNQSRASAISRHYLKPGLELFLHPAGPLPYTELYMIPGNISLIRENQSITDLFIAVCCPAWVRRALIRVHISSELLSQKAL